MGQAIFSCLVISIILLATIVVLLGTLMLWAKKTARGFFSQFDKSWDEERFDSNIGLH